jgi:hypothetical protein
MASLSRKENLSTFPKWEDVALNQFGINANVTQLSLHLERNCATEANRSALLRIKPVAEAV